MTEKLEYERHLSESLLRRLLPPGQRFTFICKPDAPGRRTRPGGSPDYVFQDDTGEEYVVETTRLLRPDVRRLERFVQEKICAPVSRIMPGLFTIEIDFDLLPRHRITVDQAERMVTVIAEIVAQRNIRGRHNLMPGIEFVYVAENRVGLVPWITMDELPYNLVATDQIALGLQQEFNKILNEASGKFIGYEGNRVLIIDIMQSGLDRDSHAGTLGDGKGVILHWLDMAGGRLNNIDQIFIHDFNVRQPPKMRIVLTGHKYVDNVAGPFIQIWPKWRMIG